jgi:hypothetical protein
MSRAVSRIYRWDHGLATELVGVEDVEIADIEPGNGDDVFFVAHEHKELLDTYFVGHVHEGHVTRIFDSALHVLGLGASAGEACFVVEAKDTFVDWHVTRDKKDDRTHRVDVGMPGVQARCVGDTRLAVSAGSFVTDFDGHRVLKATLDEREGRVSYVTGLWAESDDALQIFGDAGVFRLSQGKLTKLSDLRGQFGPFVAPDGAVFEQFGKTIGRWDGTSWVDARERAENERVIFAASRDVVVIAKGNDEAQSLFVGDTRVTGWDSTMHPERGWGTPTDAWISGSSYGEPRGGLYHWDGKSLAHVSDAGNSVHVMVASGADDILVMRGDSSLVHFDGHDWQPRGSTGVYHATGLSVGRDHAFILSAETLIEVTADGKKSRPALIGYANEPSLAAHGKTLWIASGGTLWRRDE